MLDFSIVSLPVLMAIGLVLIIFLVSLLVLLYRKQARQRRLPHEPFTPRRFGLAALKLALFGSGVFFLILAGVIVYGDYTSMKAEIAPVPRLVELPSGSALKPEEVIFPGYDGAPLAGWYVPPANGATIILLHGYNGTRIDQLWQAERLVEAGYGVLLYDERASGESGGDHRSYGWEDGPDVGGAIRFIQARQAGQDARIGISGCSIGAQIALQGAVLYPEIAAVWADGASNIRAADSPPPKNPFTLLLLGSNIVLDFMYEQALGIQAPAPMIEQIGKIAPRPIMLVGGGVEKGPFGSEAPRMKNYAGYAGSNAQVWIVEEAVHCDGSARRPGEYARRFIAFFDAVFGLQR